MPFKADSDSNLLVSLLKAKVIASVHPKNPCMRFFVLEQICVLNGNLRFPFKESAIIDFKKE